MKQIYNKNSALIIQDDIVFEVNHPSTIFTDDDIEVILKPNRDQLLAEVAKLDTKRIPLLPKNAEEIIEGRFYLDKDKVVSLDEKREVKEVSEIIEQRIKEWQPDEKISAGDLRTWKGMKYEALIDHISEKGTEPPNEKFWREVKIKEKEDAKKKS